MTLGFKSEDESSKPTMAVHLKNGITAESAYCRTTKHLAGLPGNIFQIVYTTADSNQTPVITQRDDEVKQLPKI